MLYTVVDIETTGNGYKGAKITEISIFVFDGKIVVDEFTSLVNPEQHIPAFITNLTGITNAMVRNAPKFFEIAKKIVEARSEKAIKTSFELKEVLAEFVPKSVEHKILAQIFQGIRIEVNQEIEVLKEFLLQTPELLNDDGRLSVISYHSLEDRLVKRFIRNGLFEGEPEKDVFGNFEVPLKKASGLIVPDAKEIKLNNRARSAKLRIAKKLNLNT